MKLQNTPEDELHREMQRHFMGEHHIDDVEFAYDFGMRRHVAKFYRAYRDIAGKFQEHKDIEEKAPWVRLREAMRGMQI